MIDRVAKTNNEMVLARIPYVTISCSDRTIVLGRFWNLIGLALLFCSATG